MGRSNRALTQVEALQPVKRRLSYLSGTKRFPWPVIENFETDKVGRRKMSGLPGPCFTRREEKLKIAL